MKLKLKLKRFSADHRESTHMILTGGISCTTSINVSTVILSHYLIKLDLKSMERS